MSIEKQKIVDEIYKQARINFKRRRTIIKGIDDLWQIDLAEFCSFSKENNGFKYILIVIDCFSKFVWTKPLKTKTGKEVTNAMEAILQNNVRSPKNLQSDQGTEFFNQHFKRLMMDYNINHYHTYSSKKAAIVERVIRTLKSNLYKLFALNGSHKWIDKLGDVINRYNNTVHRTIGITPTNVTWKNEKRILNSAYSNIKIFNKKHKFKVGDIVRLSKTKHLFEKGYTASWTTELFKIVKVNLTNPVTYMLEDLDGRPIKGCVYEEELQKTCSPNIYLVEKILKRNGDRLLIKWLGFKDTNNSWISSSDLR